MKRVLYIMVTLLVALLMVSVWTAIAQSSKVPITYLGDTDETIARRAQWMEGAKKEGPLTWWGILRPPEAERCIARFNKVYPFIKVVYWRGRAEEIGNKVEAEYASSRYAVDIIMGGGPKNYPRWAKQGIIEKFTHTIPGIDKVDKRMYSERGDWFIPTFSPKVPQYNNNLVSEAEAPKNWEDLLDPKWKGHIGLPASSIRHWPVLAMADGGWGIEKTADFLTKLREQKPKFAPSPSAANTLLIAGEFKILAIGNLRHALIYKKMRAPVDWVKANPVLLTGPSFTLANKAPHPNAARLFLEWQLSPLGRLVYAEISQNYSPGVDTPIAKFLDGIPFAVRTEEVLLKILDLGLIEKFDRLLLGVKH